VAFVDFLNASQPLDVHTNTKALLALPWFRNRVANLLLLEPDSEQGQGQEQVKWHVRPSTVPLCMSPGRAADRGMVAVRAAARKLLPAPPQRAARLPA